LYTVWPKITCLCESTKLQDDNAQATTFGIDCPSTASLLIHAWQNWAITPTVPTETVHPVATCPGIGSHWCGANGTRTQAEVADSAPARTRFPRRRPVYQHRIQRAFLSVVYVCRFCKINNTLFRVELPRGPVVRITNPDKNDS